jgi:hypothetical protein
VTRSPAAGEAVYVGLDLTSAFSKRPRRIDVAVIDGDLRKPVRFGQASWPHPDNVIQRDGDALEAMIREVVARAAPSAEGRVQVWAIDGPQALARAGAAVRHCEALLRTPGRTPSSLPTAASTAPFHGYIRSSVDLFAALRGRTARLIEVFPGAEWAVLAGRALPRKSSPVGKAIRRSLLERAGMSGLPAVPTADQNDAAVAAYVAWCSVNEPSALSLVGDDEFHDAGEQREGKIAHLTRALEGCPAPADEPLRAEAPGEGDEPDRAGGARDPLHRHRSRPRERSREIAGSRAAATTNSSISGG